MSSFEEHTSNDTQLAGGDISNLYQAIDRDQVYGLNLSVPEHAREVVKQWSDREDTTKYVDSGVDDQLILHIPFAQNVRIKSILLKLGRGETTPRRLRVFANHPHIIDFSDAESTKPQLDIAILEGQTAVTEYPLRVPAFASITSLSLLFSDAVGGEQTQIFYVGFKGDRFILHRDIRSKLDIPAANAADASMVDRVAEKSASQQTTAR